MEAAVYHFRGGFEIKPVEPKPPVDPARRLRRVALRTIRRFRETVEAANHLMPMPAADKPGADAAPRVRREYRRVHAQHVGLVDLVAREVESAVWDAYLATDPDGQNPFVIDDSGDTIYLVRTDEPGGEPSHWEWPFEVLTTGRAIQPARD